MASMYYSTPRLVTDIRLFTYSLYTHRKATFEGENTQVRFADRKKFKMKALHNKWNSGSLQTLINKRF